MNGSTECTKPTVHDFSRSLQYAQSLRWALMTVSRFWGKISYNSLPFENAWQRKISEYKSQLIWQVPNDVWHSHCVLFPSLIKRSRVTMGVREREVGQNCGQIKLTELPVCVLLFVLTIDTKNRL